MSQKPAWMKPSGKGWAVRTARTAFENPWLILRHYETTAPTGNPAAYGVVSFKNFALAILPLHDNGEVTLIGQHRFPLADYSWELPEGGGPIGHGVLQHEADGDEAVRHSRVGAERDGLEFLVDDETEKKTAPEYLLENRNHDYEAEKPHHNFSPV